MFTQSRLRSACLSLGLTLVAAPLAFAQGHGNDHDDGPDHGHAQSEASPEEFLGDPYLLDFDPVTGDKLGAVKTQERVEYKGRELRFNSKKSVETFQSDPEQVLFHVDNALIAQQIPFYPLTSCPVSGSDLGEMGAPVDIVYRNRLVRLCCKGCKKKFFADPDRHIATLNKAVIAAQGAKYPLETCLVSDESLEESGDEVIDVVVGNRLLRLCCAPCEKKVKADPLTFLAKLDKALAAHGEGHGDHGDSDGHGHGDDDGHGHGDDDGHGHGDDDGHGHGDDHGHAPRSESIR